MWEMNGEDSIRVKVGQGQCRNIEKKERLEQGSHVTENL